MVEEIWTTRVERLMSIFRDSLLALIPHLEAARIPWREDEAYDEWDNIAGALFENIVLRSLRWGLGDLGTDLTFPSFGHVHENDASRAVIEVFVGEPPESPEWAFMRLGSKKDPLDRILCLRMAQDGKVLADEVRILPFANTSYRVWLRDGDQLKGPIDGLSIEL